MGYWENTTYVRAGDIATVVQALDATLQREGRHRTPAPPARTPERYDVMQYGTGAENDLWGIAVFPGAPGWCVLKTAPLELLAKPGPGIGRMRLAELCKTLGVSAFQVNVYDSSSEVLLEVGADGSTLVSGMCLEGDNEGDFEQWHGVDLTEDRIEPSFEIHSELADLLPSEYAGGDVFAGNISEAIGGDNCGYCDNLVSVDTLNAHQPFTAPGGCALYYRRQR